MTCVLGMVVRREREIRQFVKTPFYRVVNLVELIPGHEVWTENCESSGRFQVVSCHPKLYKENGFKEKKDAEELIAQLLAEHPPCNCPDCKAGKKEGNKNPPLLYNLAELQNDCSKMFKASVRMKLCSIVQELYEKKLVTYPRTDARVLSTAVAKEIHEKYRRSCGTLSRCSRLCPGDSGTGHLSEYRKNPIRQRQTDHRPLCHYSYRSGIRRLKKS